MCENCGCGETKEEIQDERTFEEKVRETIDAIRPSLQAHGGDVEVVEIQEDNTVNLRLQGACQGCPGATMTMKMGIERILRDRVPELKEVVAVQ